MWKRNLLLLGICGVGVLWLAGNLLRRDRIVTAESFSASRYESKDYRETLSRVAAAFQKDWDEHHLQPAPRADSLTIARRISLGLTGTVPSLEELRALEQIPESQRVEWWISHVLEDRRFGDYVAERLARIFVGTEDGPFVVYRRRRFVTWLSDQLMTKHPRYDEIARELISGRGLWTDNPAVNFLTVTLDRNDDRQPDPVRLAARTSRAFLGVRIDCLQCHDDKLGNILLGSADAPRDGQQRDFHQLAAFFSGATSSAIGIHDREEKQRPYQYKLLGQENEETISAAVPYQGALLGNGTRRQQLADWVTHPENKAFARTAVNRFWAIVCGRPLVEPIDDIPLYSDFPASLEALADDFAAHNYDVHRLLRMIVGTDVFQCDSRAEFELTDLHVQHWAAFPLSRLMPEQLAGSVIQAASLSTINAQAHIVFRLAKTLQQNEFIQRYGDTGEDEFTVRAGTIPQRLVVMNGELVREKIKIDNPFNASSRVASFAANPAAAIETAYLAVLTRRPSAAEAAALVARVEEARGNERRRRLEDVYWMLMNSTEFAWNH